MYDIMYDILPYQYLPEAWGIRNMELILFELLQYWYVLFNLLVSRNIQISNLYVSRYLHFRTSKLIGCFTPLNSLALLSQRVQYCDMTGL